MRYILVLLIVFSVLGYYSYEDVLAIKHKHVSQIEQIDEVCGY